MDKMNDNLNLKIRILHSITMDFAAKESVATEAMNTMECMTVSSETYKRACNVNTH